jgi:2-hydroxychromene-2-carboxylate isomerase
MNTLGLMRGAAGFLLREPERFESYLETIFTAMWQQQLDLSVKEVLAETLTAAGFDPDSFLALINEDEVKTALKQTTAEAVKRGVFGAPTYFVGQEMYFGQDRLDFVKQALDADPEIAR